MGTSNAEDEVVTGIFMLGGLYVLVTVSPCFRSNLLIRWSPVVSASRSVRIHLMTFLKDSIDIT